MFRQSLALCAVVSLSLGVGAAQASGWGGYYIGLNAGTGSSETDTSRTISTGAYFAVSSIPAIESASAMALEEETFAGGAQIGVNWPISENFLFGFELDAAGFGNDTSGSSTVVYPCCGPSDFTTTNSLEQTWLGTARLRVGVNSGWFLLYATGGYAGADVRFTQTFSDTSAPVPLQVIENSEFRSGYSYGGGLEIMIESGTSLRVEYLYLDLGDIEANGGIGLAATHTSTGRAEMTDQLIRAGINFQMN